MTTLVLNVDWKKVKSKLTREQGLLPLELRLFRNVHLSRILDFGSYVQIHLVVPNFYYKEKLSKNYEHHLASAVQAQLNRPVSIEWEIRDGQGVLAESPMKSSYGFEHFVPDFTNQMVYQYVESILLGSRPFESFLVTSQVRTVGKTHLLRSLQLHFEKKGITTLFFRGRDFVMEAVDTLKLSSKLSDTAAIGREVLPSMGAVFVDDLEQLETRQVGQLRLIQLAMDCQRLNVPLVLAGRTNDRWSSSRWDERLRSVLDAMLSFEIMPPSLRLCVQYAKNRALKMGLDIPENYWDWLKTVSNPNLKIVDVSLQKMKMEMDAMRPFLAFGSAKPFSKKQVVEQVSSEICSFFRISKQELFSSRKLANLVEARIVFLAVLDLIEDWSVQELTEALQRRSHASVVQMRKRIEQETRFGDLAKAMLERLSPRVKVQ